MIKKVLIGFAALAFITDCILVRMHLSKVENIRHSIEVEHSKKDYKYSVFITSDDGPLNGSSNLDKIIRDYEVPVTLFCVGKALAHDKPRKKKIYHSYQTNPYVIIGNHSFSHANSHYKRFYSKPEKVVEDFMKNESYLNTEKIARLPGRNVWALDSLKGESNALKAAKILHNKKNYNIYGWDYELRHDKKGAMYSDSITQYKMIKKLLKDKKTFKPNQIVILMHDQMYSNLDSQEKLGELILLLQNDPDVKLKLLSDYKI